MSQSLTPFDYTTLVTDRTQGDVDALSAALRRIMDGKGTDADRALVERTDQRGAYNYTDLNRVSACMEALRGELEGLGVQLTGYERVKIERTAKPSSNLPEGYTELAYIESTGTQYVDTGVKPDQDTRIVIKLVWETSRTQIYYGAYQSSALVWSFEQTSSGDFKDYYRNTSNYVSGAIETANTEHEIDSGPAGLYVDGELKLSRESGSNTFVVDSTLYLFGEHYQNTRPSNNSLCADFKMYSAKIYSGNTLVRDFIPAQNAAEAVGLYDLVGAKFYANAGTGSFTAGDVVEQPDDPDEPDDELDPYTWYESDAPTAPQLTQYLANVASIRAALPLPEGTAGVPESMAQLRPAQANAIEQILAALETIIKHIPAAVRHCGVTICGSKGVIT